MLKSLRIPRIILLLLFNKFYFLLIISHEKLIFWLFLLINSGSMICLGQDTRCIKLVANAFSFNNVIYYLFITFI